MAKLEITPRSSAAEIAAAANQLRAAQAELRAWIEAQGTYTEGGFTYRNVTVGQIEDQARTIAGRYDYVDYGIISDATQNGTGTLQVPVGGNQFFVRGYGSNPDVSIPGPSNPNPVVSDDAAVPVPPPVENNGPLQSSGSVRHPNDPSAVNTSGQSTDGSSAPDAPGLSGSPTTRANNDAPPAPPPNDGNGSSENTVPVTNDGTSDVAPDPAAGQYGSKGDRLPGDATTSAGAERKAAADDAGSASNPSSTSTDTGAAKVTTQGGPASVAQAGYVSKIKEVRSNPLHAYANWTYQVGFYMMEKDAFQSFALTNQDSGAAMRSKPIFVTGGYAKTSSGIQNDLYLQNLRFSAVVGNTTESPDANYFDIEMEIVEPFGVSMLAELKKMAGDKEDHFQIPYLLEIKWLGYDDKGKPVSNIPGVNSKLIPVGIINVTFQITSASTIYRLTLRPFHTLPLDQYHGVIRENHSLYGDTFGSLIKSGPNSLKQYLNDKAQADVQQGRARYADTYDFEISSFDANGSRVNDGKLENSKVTFDHEGGEATVIALRGMSNNQRAAAGNEPGAAAASGAAGNDPNKQYFMIKGGSLVKSVVRMLAMNTRYFSDKITESPNSDKNNPLVLIKVVPMIKSIGKFDDIRGVYQKDIIYKIMPYYRYGEVYPFAGQASVDNRGFIKQYDWIFTGKNQDILDLKLDYNLAYFKIFEKSSSQKPVVEVATNTPDRNIPATGPLPGSQGTVYRRTTGETSWDLNKGFKNASVQEYFDQLLNSPQLYDLMTLDLDIIGDPDWIPQDRSVRPKGGDINASNNGYVDSDPAMGISMDVDGIYVDLRFRTPRDYNDKTGLMNLSASQTNIEGRYHVISVDNMFSNGRFMQKLHMYRVPQQEQNVAPGTSAAKEANDIARGRSPSAPPISVDPRINTPAPATVNGTTPNYGGAPDDRASSNR